MLDVVLNRMFQGNFNWTYIWDVQWYGKFHKKTLKEVQGNFDMKFNWNFDGMFNWNLDQNFNQNLDGGI